MRGILIEGLDLMWSLRPKYVASCRISVRRKRRAQFTFLLFSLRVLYSSMSFFWLSSLGSLNMVIRWTRSAILTDAEEKNLRAAGYRIDKRGANCLELRARGRSTREVMGDYI